MSARDVTVRFWGVRGSTPSPAPDTMGYGANTSCVELRIGDRVIILDAGSGIRRLGVELAAEFGERPLQAALIISHTHWDHIQGLPFFAPAYARQNAIPIFAAPGFGEHISRGLELQMDPIHFPIRFGDLPGLCAVRELTPGESAFGGMTVRAIPLNHPGGCGGFRFDCAGGSIAYLPDHEPYHSCTFESTAAGAASEAQAALVEFVRGCDLLILDTQYDEAEYPRRIEWGHGCLPDSVKLAVDAGVKELALFHHDPSHSDEQIDALLERARALVRSADAAVRVRAAREGDEICLAAAPSLVS